MESEKMIIVCRICLDETKTIQSIFHPFDSASKVSERISTCAGVDIMENDGLPHHICKPCIEELKVTINFVNKCQKSDRQLRSMVKNDIEEPKDEKTEVSRSLKFEIKEELPEKSEDSDDDFISSAVDNLCEENMHKYPYRAKEPRYRKNVKDDPGTTKCKISKRKLQSKPSSKNVNIEENNRIECNICGLKAKSRSALATHVRRHTGERPFICSSCPRAFSQKSALHVHATRRHSLPSSLRPQPERRHTCELCGKTFASKSNLTVHRRTHTGETPYECNFCTRRFAQVSSLIGHRRRHTGERPYSCSACGKSFSELTHLKRHRSVHSEDRPHICNVCGKGLKSPFALKIHAKLHTALREHVCEHCGAAFSVKGNLASHLRVVHSERSGQCPVCRKLCPRLEEHMVEHTGEKPHVCAECGRKFARLRGLEVHARQHSAAGRFKCSVEGCERTFAARWVHECHELKHSGRTPYSCKYCSKGFLRVCHLTKHMKLSHPNDWKKTAAASTLPNHDKNEVH